MLLKRLIQWLSGERGSPRHATRRSHTLKTYSQRYQETAAMTTPQIHVMIARREADGRDCGVAHRVLADRSDARAEARGIDPPRPGRKTYRQRDRETRAMTTPQIRAMIARREAAGRECGVLRRVLSERT